LEFPSEAGPRARPGPQDRLAPRSRRARLGAALRAVGDVSLSAKAQNSDTKPIFHANEGAKSSQGQNARNAQAIDRCVRLLLNFSLVAFLWSGLSL